MNTKDNKAEETNPLQMIEAGTSSPFGELPDPNIDRDGLGSIFQKPEIPFDSPEQNAIGSPGGIGEATNMFPTSDIGEQLYFIQGSSPETQADSPGKEQSENATDEARSLGVPRSDADFRQSMKQPENSPSAPFFPSESESDEQKNSPFDLSSFDQEQFHRLSTQFSDRVMKAFIDSQGDQEEQSQGAPRSSQTEQAQSSPQTGQAGQAQASPQAAQAEQAQASPYAGQMGQAASPQFSQTGQSPSAPQPGQTGQFSPQDKESASFPNQGSEQSFSSQDAPQAGQAGQFSPQNKQKGFDQSQGPQEDVSGAPVPPPSQMSALPGQDAGADASCGLADPERLSENQPETDADPAESARQASPRDSLGPLNMEVLEKTIAGFNDEVNQVFSSGGSKTPLDQNQDDDFNYRLFLEEREVKKIGDHFSVPTPDIEEGPAELELYESPLSLDQEQIAAIAHQLHSEIPALFNQGGFEKTGLPGNEELTHLFPLSKSDLDKLTEQIAPPKPEGGQREDPSNLYFASETSKEDIPEEAGAGTFDVEVIRKDFPILHQKVHGEPLIWFDNAATTQKPQSVIDALAHFYAHDNSNIHRGVHTLATRATDAYEDARDKIRRFIGAESASEIILPRGTTEAVNLVAKSYGKEFFHEGDEIIVTEMEHHSNIIPWKMIAEAKGAILKPAPMNDKGEIILEEFGRLLSPKTRFVAMAHVSNVLGTILPIKEMIEMAHYYGARTLVDGAQAVAHVPVDVQELNCDFYVFSGHKIFGPTGIGVLYGKKELLEYMPPWQGGGNMIDQVSFDEVTYNDPPARFEAGTNNIAGAVGLGAALDYVSRVGMENIDKYERELTRYAREAMSEIPDIIHIGTADEKVGVLTFVHKEVAPDEVGRYLDTKGVAVRSGHHCAQPALAHFGLKSAVRPSLAFYNTREEVDVMVEALIDMKNDLN